jgi:3-oxoacyl-[acyl-carrier-protein] synthase II
MELTRNGFRRVVITGMGGVTPLGRFPDFWEKLKAGISGVRRIQSFDPSQLDVQIAAECIDFDPSGYIDAKEARRMGRPAQMGVVAILDALEDAGMTIEDDIAPIAERVAVDYGSTLGAHDLAQQASFNFRTTGRRPGPFSLVEAIPNIPALRQG